MNAIARIPGRANGWGGQKSDHQTIPAKTAI
jgi:hypothetical protein